MIEADQGRNPGKRGSGVTIDNEDDGTGRRRTPRPLNAARLDELALAYVARFATSAGNLSAYLARKLRERGWEGETEAAAASAAIVARFAAAGYIDDESFARTRAQSLARRGYGQRRIAQALGQAGIATETARTALPGVAAARRAALALARKRGFGPFARTAPPADPLAARATREKHLAAMLRAGHPLDSARELVNSPSIAAAEAWVAEAEADEEFEKGQP
ncbi:MAG: RecX family transcriptional regulator [Sphingomonadales bacterium]|nr:RecX family transcriptional regulator [Sphingomonadales bacterium]